MDRELAVRKSYYEALNGNISYNSVNIPIRDGQIYQAQPDNLYVVFDNQTSNLNREGLANIQNWNTTITIGIISKQQFSVAKSIMDGIGEQIENLISPVVGFSALTQQPGWVINCVYMLSSSYMEVRIDKTVTIAVKMLTFEQKLIKQF